MNIEQLVKEYPNDMELGSKVRELYYQNKQKFEELKSSMEGKFIYESPDGGKTIYQRPWGSDLTERKLVTKQLTIFDDEAYKESE